ncbi:MAG: oligosaccharide flippase family protein, partial [Nitrospirae bacterium]|nr:oligosaccharide flippase family protein [Nitrospirota bacterium]
MLGPYRDLLKHSAIYGAGQVLSRLASFLLLPVYTSYLRPGDYGVIAILDIVGNMLGILLAIAITAAVNRYHFEEKDEIKQSQVWWTGLTFLVITTTAIVVPLWLGRETLADLTLGSTVDHGEFYYSLILPTFFFSSLVQLPSSYLRIRKWSGTFVGITLVRLVFNIGLNVYFLAVLHLGITGILLGNLITEGLNALVLLAILCSNLRAYKFHLPLLGRLINFGGPLIITSLLATLMHGADRFLLRIFLDMEQVGVYSVAYTIGQGVNSLCLLPFTMIWGVLV